MSSYIYSGQDTVVGVAAREGWMVRFGVQTSGDEIFRTHLNWPRGPPSLL